MTFLKKIFQSKSAKKTKKSAEMIKPLKDSVRRIVIKD